MSEMAPSLQVEQMWDVCDVCRWEGGRGESSASEGGRLFGAEASQRRRRVLNWGFRVTSVAAAVDLTCEARAHLMHELGSTQAMLANPMHIYKPAPAHLILSAASSSSCIR